MRVRESDAACLVVSAAMHSGRGHFLHAMTPATPALLTWSGLPAPGKALFAVGTGPLKSGQKLWRILCLSLYVRLCESGCVCEQQLCRGEKLAEFSRERKKESFSRG